MSLLQAAAARGFGVAACGPRDAFSARIEECGVKYLHVPFDPAGTNPLTEAIVTLRLLLIYRRHRPSLVHHFGLKAALCGSTAALLAGVPVVVNTITGLGYAFGGRAGLLRRAIVFFWRRICGTRTWISFQNPDDLAMFRQLKLVKPERAFLIAGSGVNTQVYAPTPATAGPGDAPRPFTFLMFSRMMWEKGVREYIEAAEWVSRECATAGGKRVRFVLLGGARPGNSTGVLTEWIAHPRTIPAAWIEERVRAGIVEWHPHDDAVLPYLREADAVVLPSYYREGIPRSLLEAMSCGKAIITTDTPGCRDTVVDGANGILVQPRDVRSLARAMAHLARDPDAGARMGTASRRIALERFSDEVVVQRTFDLYRRAGLNLPPERGNSRLEGNENRCPS